MAEKRNNKPIVWGLFAAGGTISAFVLPALILAHGLLVPLGLFGSNALSYEGMTALLGNWLVKLVVLAVIGLTLWHAAHRLRITAHDFGVRNDLLVGRIVYGFAGLFSFVTLLTLLSI